MHRSPLAALISLGLALLFAGAGCQSTKTTPESSPAATILQQHDPHLSQLSWMTGSWINETENGRSEEHWTTADGGTMLGVNRTIVIRDGVPRTSFYEFLRIESSDDGIAYLAAPLGRYPPTPFHMVRNSEQEAVFENPEHDYPQRIIYRREGDQLFGTIEGEVDGEVRISQWSWRRARLSGE